MCVCVDQKSVYEKKIDYKKQSNIRSRKEKLELEGKKEKRETKNQVKKIAYCIVP